MAIHSPHPRRHHAKALRIRRCRKREAMYGCKVAISDEKLTSQDLSRIGFTGSSETTAR